ncbi:5-hydroxytryptamine receptor 2A-like [Crassostrea angulata]|uniref:5-hydroxytryptamine receptor 2A-like n=1 Tax=Magallana angulata TaxID=2784310 RepID=UPI0022B12152|nr:5-hydroxytryptamine receptor 2A-like [Crassostrea angulata]
MEGETIQDLLSKRYSDRLIPNTVIHLTEGAIGIFGNIIVLVMYSRYIADKNGTRYFIPVLAVVNLMGCLSNVVQFQLDNTMRYTYPDVHLCKTLFFLMIMSGGLSAHLIFAISLQRYLMICRPFGQQMTRKYCRLAFVIFVLFSFGYAAPVLKFGGFNEIKIWLKRKSGNVNRTFSFTIGSCHFDDGSHGPRVMVPYFGTLLVLSFINIIATSGLYIPVTKTIYRTLSSNKNHGNRVSRMLDGDTPISSKDTHSTSVEKIKMSEIPQQSQNTKSKCSGTEIKAGPGIKSALQETDREQKARKRISVMFLIIIIVYVVSYLTSLATQVYEFLSTERMSGYRLHIRMFCLRLNLLNHIANPYIYWFYDVKFRKELQKLCCKRH